MKTLLDHYTDYGLWANKRFVERLLQEPEEVLDRPVPSSFPSLRATLLHIRDAEHTWWGRLTGNPTQWPAEADGAIDTVLLHGQRLRDHIVACAEEELCNQRIYSDLRGNEHRQPAWQMIMHCLNHSTQHRGQLITMMRVLGLKDIPANDLVAFQRTLA